MNKEETMIRVKKNTRERLKTFGIKGENYDTIVNRIMNDAEEYRKSKQYTKRNY